jgi:hypothetical protein
MVTTRERRKPHLDTLRRAAAAGRNASANKA